MAILKYITRRLLVLIPVLLGITIAAFLLGRLAPGDYDCPDGRKVRCFLYEWCFLYE